MSDAKRSWFSTGYDGIEREKERLARMQSPNRFWMKEGTSREIMFVDDEPFSIYEHNFRANGSWANWLTCLRDSNDVAPCCEKLGDKSRYFVGYYTIVDLTQHTDAKGNKYQYEVKLLPAKMKTLQMIRRKKQDRGSLIGSVYKVHRYSKDDPNCGGEFEFQKDGDLDKLFSVANYRGKKLVELFSKDALSNPESLQRLKDTFQVAIENGQIVPKVYSFNYFYLLAPREPRDVKAIMGSVTPDGAAVGAGPADDSVPF